jgi:hypothetical protein
MDRDIVLMIAGEIPTRDDRCDLDYQIIDDRSEFQESDRWEMAMVVASHASQDLKSLPMLFRADEE